MGTASEQLEAIVMKTTSYNGECATRTPLEGATEKEERKVASGKIVRHQEAASHIIMEKEADVDGVKELWHCERKSNIVVFRLPFSRPTNAGVMTLKGEIQHSSRDRGSHWATNLG